MFGFADERKAALKKSRSAYASRAKALYHTDFGVCYTAFLGGTDSDDNWDSYKAWLQNWIIQAEERVNEEDLANLYLHWLGQDDTSSSGIKSMWPAHDNESIWTAQQNGLFDEKKKESAQFFLFAAYLETMAIPLLTSWRANTRNGIDDEAFEGDQSAFIDQEFEENHTEFDVEELEEDDNTSMEIHSEAATDDEYGESPDVAELMKVKELFENALIDEDEYKALKKKILGI